MGIAHINGKLKLIVFGGHNPYNKNLDSIEEWDDESETWIMSTMKLSEAKRVFGYCQLPSFCNQIHLLTYLNQYKIQILQYSNS